MADNIAIGSLINSASWVVLAVMLFLIASSLLSWFIIFQKGFLLRKSKILIREFEELFWAGKDLSSIFQHITKNKVYKEGLSIIFSVGLKEFSRLYNECNMNSDDIMEGTKRMINVAITKEQEKLESRVSMLATIGSISPYIGLFGTVIGIMNSFIGLANVDHATLSVVAPGIAEALLATAMGLFVAIPAILAYNRYISIIDNISINYETFSQEFLAILHRKVFDKSITKD